MTTDSQGQAIFDIPFKAPAGKPIVTATATDPEGNTSELSPGTPRQPILQIPTKTLLLSPATTVNFSAGTGDAIALQDPDAAPFDLTWNLSLSVTAGTLFLTGTNGLVGSGDGTATLQYQGTISDLDAALAGMIYFPEPGFHGLATLSLVAQSSGATPIQAELQLSDHIFPVTTTADSGPGSLRQAILDSNLATGASNLITFAIPGQGAHSIVLASPLPTISNPLLIDGWSQPGFSGAPLIALEPESAGSLNSLPISSANVTVRGLSINRVAGGVIDSYEIDTATDERLMAQVHSGDSITGLLLFDSQGHLLAQSDGQSDLNHDDLIDFHIPAGSVYLEVATQSGTGNYTLTTVLTASNTPFQPIPLVSTPTSIVAGDFAGDGRTDLAVATYSYDSPGTVSVLMNNGDGTFQPAVQYAVGSGPTSLVTGDFTGNGHLDLAIENSEDGTISVLLGNGDGTFQPQITFAAVVSNLVAGDFNGDGRTDLATLVGNGVSVLLSNGDGTFQAPKISSVAWSEPMSMVAAKFTGDGNLDLAITNQFFGSNSGDVITLLGNGDGTFRDSQTLTAGVGPALIVAGAFSGDGHTDLVVANQQSQDLSFFLGNGDGTFQPERRIALGFYPTSLLSGNLSGAGRLDLAVAGNENDISVILGNGDGTFQPNPILTAAQTQYLVAGDFNGDGRLDLAAASSTGVGGSGFVSVLFGEGDGAFQTQQQSQTGVSPWSVVAADFTGDGRLDLVTANASSNTISVLLGNGDGTFQPEREFAAGSFPVALAAGDFNGDGRLDLAVADLNDNNISLLFGNGDGTFQAPQEFPSGEFHHPTSFVVGDFNGDGRLDLAVGEVGDLVQGGTDPPDIIVLMGNGNGTFQAPERLVPANGEGNGELVAGDFNGDGRLDLAFSSLGTNAVSVLLGNGDGTFGPAQQIAVSGVIDSLVAGDFDGDGRTDLAVVSGSFSPTVSVFLAKSDGTFASAREYALPGFTSTLVTGDFNDDGRLDLAVADVNYSNISILLGNGDGTFQPQRTFATASAPFALVADDFNDDGQLDLATANGNTNDVSLLLGNGDGTFLDPSQVATIPRADPLVVDVNDDGTDDVLVVSAAGEILYRQGQPLRPGSFDPPLTINAGNPSREIAWVPSTGQGSVLASLDAHDDAISFYAFRNGQFVRLKGSLDTGRLPAQIITADLLGDGLTDLVVRNAGDGTLSVYSGSDPSRSNFNGPPDPFRIPPSFLPPVSFFVGIGVSDVQAVDTTGSGRLDLVVTNKLTGQVSILRNLGNGTFAPPERYPSGTGLYALDDGSGSPQVTSMEATSGVVAAQLVAGGPIDLVTTNRGSNTLGVLAGLGNGHFADPVVQPTVRPVQLLRVADLNGDGIPDLAVLDAQGVSIYLGNGKGGFLPPVTYAAGATPTGLTVADINQDAKLDLLVSDAYGDVLVLIGQGDGTFQPYHDANQSIELAVADLTGNGAKDVIYADQGLDRVVVDYGAGNSSVLGDQSTGLLDPGAVKLADLNGDGIPDLIVANSGSNNVLIYPGLGNGQFGPAENGGHGYFVGTNPVAIAVANLNGHADLLVANAGSNDVSILLGQGSGSSWTLTPGPRIQTQGGPDALAVGTLTGSSTPDLFVANSQANTVEQFQGIGSGFFNDQNPTVYPVGQAPAALFLGNFGQGQGLATLNAGSNDGTLISGLGSVSPLTQTFATGGEHPTTGFAGDFTDNGLTDLVVGNSGDGHLALLMAGAAGLSLSQTLVSPQAPDPTGLSFGEVSGGELSFYVSSAGREAATILAFDLGGGESETGIVTPGAGLSLAGVLSQATSGSVQQVAQLLSLTGSNLDLAATLLTVSVLPGNLDGESSAGAPATASASGPGQSMAQNKDKSGTESIRDELEDQPDGAEADARPAMAKLPAWERLSIGLERAWERARATILELENRLPTAAVAKPQSRPAASQPSRPSANSPAQPTTRARPSSMSDDTSTGVHAPSGATLDQRQNGPSRVIDAALEELDIQPQRDAQSVRLDLRFRRDLAPGQHGTARALVAAVLAAKVLGTAQARRARWGRRKRWASTVAAESRADRRSWGATQHIEL